MTQPDTRTIYWHRQLPPLDAEPIGEHVVEANSSRIAGSLSHGDDRWRGCYADLMANAERRLRQEIARLGGDCAHVHDESIGSRRDDAAGEAWLHGAFRYTLFRQPRPA